MLIGLTGYAQHGKDTIASLLVEEYGFTRVGFADALKELTYQVNPLVSCDLDSDFDSWTVTQDRLSDVVAREGWEGAKKEPEVRRLFQELGTVARHVIGPNVWVDALIKTLIDKGLASYEQDWRWNEQLSVEGRVVISDVRFPNEAELVSQFGQLWKVTRTSPGGRAFDNGIGTEHESEKHVASLRYAHNLHNYGTVDVLLSQVRRLLEAKNVFPVVKDG